jgi:Mg2+ and Co2+ transporter CorA
VAPGHDAARRLGSYALTDDVRERIVTALEEAGVQARPPIQEANRHDTIRLALASDGRRSTLGDTPSAAEVVAVTEWRPGEAPRAIALDDVEGAEGIVWFDVDVLQADEESVCELVLPHCRGQLTREIVVDLLDADPRPKVTSYGEDVRAVSTLRVTAREPEEGGEDPAASKAGRFWFEVVEIAAGEGWLMTTRHKAHRELYAWLEQWELDFDGRGAGTEQATLREVRGLAGLLRVRLTALARPAREAVDAWLPGVTDDAAAVRLAELIDRALRQLFEISEVLRGSIDLMSSSLAQAQRAQGERLENRVTLITSMLLVPTLVAGLYGGNTKLPGRDSWSGFAIMVGLMVGSAIASYLLIAGVRAAREEDERDGGRADEVGRGTRAPRADGDRR